MHFSPLDLSEPALPLHVPGAHQGAASVQALEQRSFNAWPALRTAVVGDWLLRSTLGYTKRANSANALQAGAALDAALLQSIEDWYARQGQACIFRLSPLAPVDVDALLQARGYQRIESSLFLQRATQQADALWRPQDGVQVVVEAAPSPDWLAGNCAANGLEASQQHAHGLIVSAIPLPCAFVSLVQNGRTCAWGMAVLERGAFGLYDVVVAPRWRGRGLGRQLLQGLLQWAASQGASAVDLQVRGGNVPAQALYAALGFGVVYGYHYRVGQRMP